MSAVVPFDISPKRVKLCMDGHTKIRLLNKRKGNVALCLTHDFTESDASSEARTSQRASLWQEIELTFES